MEGKLNLKNRSRKLAHSTVLQTAKQSKLQNPFLSFLCTLSQTRQKKTTIEDLHQDSQTGLPTEYFAMCFEHFEASCFNRNVLNRNGQRISRGFTLRKVQYHQYTQSRKIHWTLITQEMREDLQIYFFLRNILWTFLWDPLLPYQEMWVSKIDFF